MKLVQDTLRRFVDEGQIAGCAARIMKDDTVLFEGSFGYADIENKIRMSSADTTLGRSIPLIPGRSPVPPVARMTLSGFSSRISSSVTSVFR